MSDAPRCATCRWWVLERQATGLCVAIVGRDLVGDREVPYGKAVAHDGCCGPGSILTDANFGCVLHEAKP